MNIALAALRAEIDERFQPEFLDDGLVGPPDTWMGFCCQTKTAVPLGVSPIPIICYSVGICEGRRGGKPTPLLLKIQVMLDDLTSILTRRVLELNDPESISLLHQTIQDFREWTRPGGPGQVAITEYPDCWPTLWIGDDIDQYRFFVLADEREIQDEIDELADTDWFKRHHRRLLVETVNARMGWNLR